MDNRISILLKRITEIMSEKSHKHIDWDNIIWTTKKGKNSNKQIDIYKPKKC